MSFPHDPDPDDDDQPGLTVRALYAEDLDDYLAFFEDEQPAPTTEPLVIAPPLGPASARVSGRGARRTRPGRPGASAYAMYLQLRAEERRMWLAELPWRVAIVTVVAIASSILGYALSGPLPAWPLVVPLTLWAVWTQRLHVSAATKAWRTGARGERGTARRLRRLEREGWVILHDLAIPGARANLDHIAAGPGGLFVIDSKRWRGHVWVDGAGRAWHGSYPLQRVLDTVCWETAQVADRLIVPFPCTVRAVVCLHRGSTLPGGIYATGIAIVNADDLLDLLRSTAPVLTHGQIVETAALLGARFPSAI